MHESISWVEAFPSGITTPAFSDGTLVKNVDPAVTTALDEKHYLFLESRPVSKILRTDILRTGLKSKRGRSLTI